MLNHFAAILLITALFPISCGPQISNKLDEMKLICGDGYDDRKQYLKVENFDSTSARVADSNQALTSRGCIERPKSDPLFIVSHDKSKGVWVNPDSLNSVKLENIGETTTPSVCSATVDLVSKNLTIDFESSTGWNFAYALKVQAALMDPTSPNPLASWEALDLQPKIRLPLGDLSLSMGDYPIVATIRDELKGVATTLNCKLRIDPSALLIYPADKIKNQRIFAGHLFNVVDPGYQPTFYIQDGFKDVSIEYCLEKLDLNTLAQSALDKSPCESPLPFLNSSPTPLTEGIWKLKFRGQRSSIQTEWQQSSILVENICQGNFANPSEIGNWCTGVVGTLHVGSSLSTQQAEKLSSIGFFHGKLSVESRQAKDSFSNLIEVVGDLEIVASPNSPALSTPESNTIDGFEKLEKVVGNLSLKESNVIGVKGFSNLQSITGRLDVENLRAVESFTAFARLESVGEIYLKSLSTLVSIDSFRKLKKLDSLRMHNMWSLEGLKNFSELKQIKKLNLTGAFKMSDFRTSENDLSVTDSIILEETEFWTLSGLLLPPSGKIRIVNHKGEKFSMFGHLPELESVSIEGVNSKISSLDIPQLKKLKDFSIKDTKVTVKNAFLNLENLELLWIENSGVAELPIISVGRRPEIGGIYVGSSPGFTHLGSGLDMKVGQLWLSDLEDLESLDGLESIFIKETFVLESPSFPITKLRNIDALKKLKTTAELEIRTDKCEIKEDLDGIRKAFYEFNSDSRKQPKMTVEFTNPSCAGVEKFEN